MRRSLALDDGPADGTGPWEQDLARWMAPFLAALGHKGRQRWAPVYLAGLLGPGDRKSVQPMAARLAPDDHEQLHHFIATSAWVTVGGNVFRSTQKPWFCEVISIFPVSKSLTG